MQGKAKAKAKAKAKGKGKGKGNAMQFSEKRTNHIIDGAAAGLTAI
jgi:hypothetical protein